MVMKFLSSFVAGGIAAGTMTFALYTSFRQDSEIVRLKVNRMRSQLEPSLRFHLLKEDGDGDSSVARVEQELQSVKVCNYNHILILSE